MTTAIYGALANAALVWGAYSAPCIFDANSIDALGISGTGPKARVRSAAVPGIAADAAVAVGGVSYTVADIDILAADELLLTLVKA
jgi:hypothetical protein